MSGFMSGLALIRDRVFSQLRRVSWGWNGGSGH